MGEISARLIRNIRKSEFISSVATLASGQILAQLISIFTVPIVSRLYTQNEFGEFSIITSTGAIVTGFATMGLTSAIMSPKEDKEAHYIFSVTFLLQLIISSIVLIICLVLAPYYQFFTSSIPYVFACFIMYIYIVLTNLCGMLSVYINRIGMNRVLFWNSLISALSTLLITVPLGLFGFGTIGFLLATILSLLIANIHMIRKSNPFILSINFNVVKDVCRNYKDFILYQCPANLVTGLAVQLPNQLFAKLFGNGALGGYSMSQRLLGYPLRLIGAPINTVYFRTASKYHKEGLDLSDFTYSLITKILLFSFIPLLTLIVFGNQIFVFLLGDKWGVAGDISSILALSYVLIFCNSSTANCRVALEKQKINFIMSIIQLVFIVLSVIIGILINKNLFFTVVCFSIGNSIFQILDMAINFYCMKKNMFRYCIFVTAYCIFVSLLGFGIKKFYF